MVEIVSATASSRIICGSSLWAASPS